MQQLLRHVLVVLLAVFVTASMGLSVVQASMPMHESPAMTMPMPMASATKQSTDNDCKACLNDLDGKFLLCGMGTVCALNPVSQELPVIMTLSLVHYPEFDFRRSGTSPVPEPYPPRPLTFI